MIVLYAIKNLIINLNITEKVEKPGEFCFLDGASIGGSDSIDDWQLGVPHGTVALTEKPRGLSHLFP